MECAHTRGCLLITSIGPSSVPRAVQYVREDQDKGRPTKCMCLHHVLCVTSPPAPGHCFSCVCARRSDMRVREDSSFLSRHLRMTSEWAYQAGAGLRVRSRGVWPDVHRTCTFCHARLLSTRRVGGARAISRPHQPAAMADVPADVVRHWARALRVEVPRTLVAVIGEHTGAPKPSIPCTRAGPRRARVRRLGPAVPIPDGR